MNSLSDTSVKHLQKFPKNLEPLFSSGSRRIFRDPGFEQYTVRDSRLLNGIRDLTATREARFAKIWAQMRDWERQQYSGQWRIQSLR